MARNSQPVPALPASVPRGKAPVTRFVSIDPDCDTPPHLKSHAANSHLEHWGFLTGDSGSVLGPAAVLDVKDEKIEEVFVHSNTMCGAQSGRGNLDSSARTGRSAGRRPRGDRTAVARPGQTLNATPAGRLAMSSGNQRIPQMHLSRLACLLLCSALAAAPAVASETTGPPASVAAPTREEALARAQLLHAALDGALQVMHRDFFRKGESRAIPSESLKDVFKTMRERWGVTLRWLASEETIMNAENKAVDAFEAGALLALTTGKKEVSVVEGRTFRYAGPVMIRNECLKCHVPHRTTLDDRFAALSISMPVQPVAPAKAP